MSKAPARGAGLAAVEEARCRGSRALSGAVLEAEAEAEESTGRRRLTSCPARGGSPLEHGLLAVRAAQAVTQLLLERCGFDPLGARKGRVVVSLVRV